MPSLIASKEYLVQVYSAVYSTIIDDSLIVAQLPDTATDSETFSATSYFQLYRKLNIYSLLCLHEKF